MKVSGVAVGAFVLLFSLFPQPGNPYSNLRDLGGGQPVSLADLQEDPAIDDFMNAGLASLSSLDTDGDGVPDVSMRPTPHQLSLARWPLTTLLASLVLMVLMVLMVLTAPLLPLPPATG